MGGAKRDGCIGGPNGAKICGVRRPPDECQRPGPSRSGQRFPRRGPIESTTLPASLPVCPPQSPILRHSSPPPGGVPSFPSRRASNWFRFRAYATSSASKLHQELNTTGLFAIQIYLPRPIRLLKGRSAAIRPPDAPRAGTYLRGKKRNLHVY